MVPSVRGLNECNLSFYAVSVKSSGFCNCATFCYCWPVKTECGASHTQCMTTIFNLLYPIKPAQVVEIRAHTQCSCIFPTAPDSQFLLDAKHLCRHRARLEGKLRGECSMVSHCVHIGLCCMFFSDTLPRTTSIQWWPKKVEHKLSEGVMFVG